MKQSKFSLADVLTLLTAIAFGFICFLGENFSTLGDTYASLVWAAGITLLLAGTAFLAKLFKRASGNFRNNFIFEVIALFLFTSFTGLFSYISFPHYFNVSAKKAEIQNKLQNSIMQADNMFLKYEQEAKDRIVRYENTLKAAVALQNPIALSKYGFTDNVPYSSQVAHKVSILQTELFPPNYSDTVSNKGIKEVAQAWLYRAMTTKNSWKSIGIVNVVTDVENNSRNWLTQLESFYQKRQQGEESTDFEYPLSFSDVNIYFTTPSKPTFLSTGLATLAYLLMMLSWYVTKRHSRRTGILTKAPYEIVL